MIESRFAIERMAAERQAERLWEMGEALGAPQAVRSSRVIALRVRTARLLAVAALALALTLGGLLNPASEVAADSLGGGVSVASGIGYVP